MVKRKRFFFAIFLSLMMAAASAVFDRSAGAQTDAQNGAGAQTGVFHSDTFEMQVKAGFGRLVVNRSIGNWTSFRVMLANQGEPVVGHIIVHVESDPNPTPRSREFTKEINLPTGSRQLHEIPVHLGDTGEDPVVRVISDDRIIAETTVKVEHQFYGGNDQLEIAVVDSDPTTLNNINAVDITRSPKREPFKNGPSQPAAQNNQADQNPAQPPQPSSSPQASPTPPPAPPGRRRGGFSQQSSLAAHPTVVQTDALPRDYVCYDPIDVLVIGDAPLSLLAPEQSRALKLWVASGGMLIVTGAADVAGLRAAGLDSILPVEMQGAITVPALAGLTDIYGRFESSDALLLMTSRLKPGARALLGTPEAPIAAEKYYGSGLVRFVALNPRINPYRGWAGTKDLWADLLLPAVEKTHRQFNWLTVGRRGNSRGYSQSNRYGIQNFLFRLAEIKPPSANFFLLFLFSYILLVGPLNYFVLKWMGKLDLAWVTIPGVVILFTVASVSIAQLTRGGSSIGADASLVELHQRDGITRALGGLLIMPTSKATHELTFRGDNTFANDVDEGSRATSTSAAEGMQTERDKDGLTLRVPMTTWTSSMFQTRSVSDNSTPLIAISPAEVLQPAPGDAPQQADARAGKTVTVKNLGNAKITRAVLLSAAGMSAAFDLEPGREQQVSVEAFQQGTFTDWYASQFQQGSEEADLFAELAYVMDREIDGEAAFVRGFFDTLQMAKAFPTLQRPLLVGFVETSPMDFSFQDSLRRHSKSLYVVHL